MSRRIPRLLAPLSLLIALLMSACSNQTPTPTAVATTAAAAPTAAPTVAPTAAPTAEATAAPTAAPAAGFGAAWTPEPCASFEVAEPLAARSDCGYVSVPERHAGGERTIALAVMRVRATTDRPGAPLVVGTGGPGGQGFMLTSPQAYSRGIQIPSLWGGILAEHDVIFFSQRGTRYARPDLVCPAFDAANYEAALSRLSPEGRVATARAGLQACADAFIAQGVDLAAYNSDENAADIVSIAETLGYGKIFYYGESYGTILGQFLIRNHPAILEGVILDGIMPVTFTSYDQQVDKAADGCAVVQVPQLPAASDALARSDVPALLLSGALDPATLAPLSAIVAGGLPNSYAVVFPNRGHVQDQNQCAIPIIAAFLSDPGTAPDTSCLDPRHVVFSLPIAQRVTALSPDERAAFSLDLPPGFAHLPVPLTPYAYLNGPLNLALSAFPAGTTADQALAQIRAQLETTVGTPEGLESGAGPEVAGLPSQLIRYSTPKVAAVDLIAFADARGAYLVTAVVATPDLVQPFRAEILPALLASVEVGK